MPKRTTECAKVWRHTTRHVHACPCAAPLQLQAGDDEPQIVADYAASAALLGEEAPVQPKPQMPWWRRSVLMRCACGVLAVYLRCARGVHAVWHVVWWHVWCVCSVHAMLCTCSSVNAAVYTQLGTCSTVHATAVQEARGGGGQPHCRLVCAARLSGVCDDRHARVGAPRYYADADTGAGADTSVEPGVGTYTLRVCAHLVDAYLVWINPRCGKSTAPS